MEQLQQTIKELNLQSQNLKNPGLATRLLHSKTSEGSYKERFEKAYCSLYQSKHAIAYSSGCAAASALLKLCEPGKHTVLCVDDVYGGTQRLFRRIATYAQNLNFQFLTMLDMEDYKKNLKQNNVKIVWLESPTNPTLKVMDIKEICQVTRQESPETLVVVDNTFATVINQNPYELGADIIVESCTKYIGGHSDVLLGVLTTNKTEVYNQLFQIQQIIQTQPGEFDCQLALTGIKTLPFRVEQATKNAIQIATFLSKHPKVEKVTYPGLPSHPQYEIIQKQMKNSGSMITFYLKGKLQESYTFLKSTKIFTLAESLGAVESLCELPAVMTHASVPAQLREELGISDNQIRLSIGIENVEDLIRDLDNALGKI